MIKPQFSIFLVFLLSSILVLILMLGIGPSAKAQSAITGLKQVRTLEIDQVFREEFFGDNSSDLLGAGGIGFPPQAHTLLMLDGPGNGLPSLVIVTPPASGKGRITLASFEIDDPINIAFDTQSTDAKGFGLPRLFLLDRGRGELNTFKGAALNAMNPESIERSNLQYSGIANPQGMTFDPGKGVLYILDAELPSIVRLTPRPGRIFDRASVSVINLPSNLGVLRGLAFNPEDNHLYVVNPEQNILYKLTLAGEVAGSFDFPDVGMLQGMIFAPSLDLTDHPDVFHLYLATDRGLMGEVTEWVLPGSLSPRASPLASIYVSTRALNGSVDKISYGREDILRYDAINDAWFLHFDGSNVGLGGSDVGINSFHIMADGSILMSLLAPTELPDVGMVDNSDIVRFIPASLGENNTAGVFELYFKGANVGLGPSWEVAGEKIDALGILSDGRLVISTSSTANVPGVLARDEDLIAFTATSLGETTSGTWELYFDASDMELKGMNDEDLTGVSVGDNGDLFLTTRGAYSVSGLSDDGTLSGDGADILRCELLSFGSSTSCSFELIWSGSAHGLSGHSLNGIHLVYGVGNGASTVTVSAPANGSTFMAGEPITFTGTASDTEDGNLTGSLVWSSSLDGPLGNGDTVVSSSLSVGTHLITASVTDSSGLTDLDFISITITNAP